MNHEASRLEHLAEQIDLWTKAKTFTGNPEVSTTSNAYDTPQFVLVLAFEDKSIRGIPYPARLYKATYHGCTSTVRAEKCGPRWLSFVTGATMLTPAERYRLAAKLDVELHAEGGR